MAPELTQREEELLMKLAGRIVQPIPIPPDLSFLAEILLRTIRALERADDYQREQRERS